MGPRVRKLVGSIGVLVFLAAYIVLAIAIAERLPDNRLVQLIYFVVAGIAWGLPLLPLFTWMERGTFRRR